MSNQYYNGTGYPGYSANGDSASARSEFAAIQAAFDKLPALAGNGLRLVRINQAETAQETVPASSSSVASSVMMRDANSDTSVNNLLLGYATPLTAGGTLTAASPYIIPFSGVANQTLGAPVVTTLVAGQSWKLDNSKGTGTQTFNSSGGNLICTLDPGDMAIVQCNSIVADTTATPWSAWLPAQRQGDATKTFSVAAAVLSTDAVRLAQIYYNNLIINSNIANAINQNGAASIVTGSNVYTFDQWWIGSDGKLYQPINSENLMPTTAYALSWQGTATAEYMFSATATTSTPTSLTAGTFSAVANGGTITTPSDVLIGKQLWIRWTGVTASLATFNIPMLTPGPVVTSYQYPDKSQEFKRCEYYMELLDFPVTIGLNSLAYQNGATATGTAQYHSKKRVAPTSFVFTGAPRVVYPSSIGGTAGTLTAVSSTTNITISSATTIATASSGFIDTFSVLAKCQF